MDFFKTKEDKNNEIKVKEYKTEIKFKNSSCKVLITDALVREKNGTEVLLDEVVVKSMINDIAKAAVGNKSKYNKIPTKIVISHAEDENSDKSESDAEVQDVGIISSYEPRYTFDDVCVRDNIKKEIRTSLNIIKNREILHNEWGLGNNLFGKRAVILNFYGQPGTGKSMMAEAIAHELKKKVCLVNYAELESKFVGETPKNIKKVFAAADKEDAVLIFDEADSFLGKRLTSVTQSADYGVNITRSVLLVELEKFEGVVIFTTNLLTNYDDAFKRRILSNILFDLPDMETRKAIWKNYLSKKIPLNEEVALDILASKYMDVTGADIKDIIFFAAAFALERGVKEISYEDFDYAYDAIKARYKNKMDNLTEFQKVKEEVISAEQYKEEINSYKEKQEN